VSPNLVDRGPELKDLRENSSTVYPQRYSYFDLAFFLGVVAFLYLQLFTLPATPIFSEKDHLIYTHNALRMLDGEVIFRDFFQFIVPGSEVVYLLFFSLFGIKFWVLNLVVLLLNVGTAWLMLEIGKKVLSGFAAYLPPLIYLAFGARWLGLEGSHRWFCVLFVLLAVYLLCSERSPIRLVLAGLSLGLATCFTQTTGVLAFAGTAAFLSFEKWKEGESLRTIATPLFYLSIPFLAISSGFVWVFASMAGFAAYWDQTVVFLSQNAPGDIWNNTGAFFMDLPDSISFSAVRSGSVTLFYYLLFPAAYLGFVGIYLVRRSSRETQGPAIFFIAAVGAFLLLSLQIPTGIRLYQISPPALIVLCWVLMQSKFGTVLAKVMFGGLLVLAVLLPLRTQTVWSSVIESPTGNIAFLSPETFERYQWVASNTKPGDYIFEANHPDVYFPFMLRNPTRMYYVRPNRFTRPEQVDDVVRSLEEKKPELILWNAEWSAADGSRAPNDPLGPLYDYLVANYERTRDFAAPVADVKVANLSIQAWRRKVGPVGIPAFIP
jgi:hypothetical protein